MQSVSFKPLCAIHFSAIKLRVDSVSPNNTTSKFPWTWLNVTYRQNIYKRDGKTSTPRNQSFSLLLPCRCPRLDSLRGRPALLLTNIDFNIQRIFLGDGDLVLPLRKNLVNRIQKLSAGCPNNVVKDIYSLLQILPTESPNSKWSTTTSQLTHQKRVKYTTGCKWRHSVPTHRIFLVYLKGKSPDFFIWSNIYMENPFNSVYGQSSLLRLAQAGL